MSTSDTWVVLQWKPVCYFATSLVLLFSGIFQHNSGNLQTTQPFFSVVLCSNGIPIMSAWFWKSREVFIMMSSKGSNIKVQQDYINLLNAWINSWLSALPVYGSSTDTGKGGINSISKDIELPQRTVCWAKDFFCLLSKVKSSCKACDSSRNYREKKEKPVTWKSYFLFK